MFGLMQTMVSPDSVIMALNPIVWLDARQLAGANGTLIATWSDRSGVGRNATQATDTKQPNVQHAISGMGDGARFDGGDGLQTATIDLTASATATLVAVSREGGGATDAIVVETSPSWSANVGGIILAYIITAGPVVNMDFGCSGNSGATFKLTTSNDQTGVRRFGLVSDYALADASEVTPYSNGGTPTTSNTSFPNTGTSHGNYNMNIGARSNATSVFLTGDISHVLLFTAALSTGQFAALDDALRSITG